MVYTHDHRCQPPAVFFLLSVALHFLLKPKVRTANSTEPTPTEALVDKKTHEQIVTKLNETESLLRLGKGEADKVRSECEEQKALLRNAVQEHSTRLAELELELRKHPEARDDEFRWVQEKAKD